MVITLSAFALCLSIASAGILELPYDLILRWDFESDESIAFTFTVPKAITDEFGWVGVGFKYREDGDSMDKSDLVNIILGEPVADSYARESGPPDPDVFLGGTEDIAPTFNITEGEDRTNYSWVRATNTGDEWDKVFVSNGEYYAMWAFGEMDRYGNQVQHFTGNRGKVAFILTDYREYGQEGSTLSFLSLDD